MKLLIDIGNTNSSIGICDREHLTKTFFVKTCRENISGEAFARMLSRWSSEIKQIFLVSVVPEATVRLKQLLGDLLPSAELKIVGEDLEVPIVNRYSAPEEVGKDRLVASFGAVRKYGAPVVVVDFGTAVTFDVINSSAEYEGGLIFPGLSVSFDALIERAVLLKKADIFSSEISSVIGKDTAGSMASGIRLGYASLCDGILEHIFSQLPEKPFVVATGGDAGAAAPFAKHIDTVNKMLIFSGLCGLSHDLDK